MNEAEVPRSTRGRLALAGCVLGLLGLVLVTLLQASVGVGSSEGTRDAGRRGAAAHPERTHIAHEGVGVR